VPQFLKRLSAIALFLALVFLVLFIALCFFQTVETLPGSSGFKSGMTHPFRLARENYTQAFYLILNLCLIYAMAHNGARQKTAALAREISQAAQEQVHDVEGGAVAVQSIAGVAVETEKAALETRKTMDQVVRVAQALTSSLARFKLAT